VVSTLKAAERIPSRIETSFVPMVGIVVEIGATFDAQPQAVIPTQGLKRQTQYHCVAEQRLEVDKVALQPASEVIVRLDPRIDVQLLDIDLQLVGDLTQAPYALSTDLDRGGTAD
jgi:hypothetical protein